MIRRSIYPGSFDPITNGHLDIIERGAQLFDEIIIGVLNNPDKISMFSVSERKTMVSAVLPNTDNCLIRVEDFSGLLVEYAKKRSRGIVGALGADVNRVLPSVEHGIARALVGHRPVYEDGRAGQGRERREVGPGLGDGRKGYCEDEDE